MLRGPPGQLGGTSRALVTTAGPPWRSSRERAFGSGRVAQRTHHVRQAPMATGGTNYGFTRAFARGGRGFVNTEDKTIAAGIPPLQQPNRFPCISLSSPLSHKGRPHRYPKKRIPPPACVVGVPFEPTNAVAPLDWLHVETAVEKCSTRRAG